MLRILLSAGLAGTLVLASREVTDANGSRAKIASGLQAEAAGDLAGARRDLALAMQADRGYLPVWTLANFSLRNGDPRYVAQLSKALAIAVAGGQDTTGVFDLAFQTGNDLVHGDQELSRLYVPYLINAGHSEAVYAAAEGLRDPEIRLMAAECLMNAGRDAEFRKLTGAIAFNSEMNAPGEWSFDWKFNQGPEHSFDFQGAGRGVRMDVNGRQAEQVDLLSERIAVSPGARYRLEWETQVDSGRPKLLWVVAGKPVDAAASGSTVFGGAAGARLVLRLERALGEQAFAGTIRIREVRVHAVGKE